MIGKFFLVLVLLFVLFISDTKRTQENEFPPCSSPVDWDRVLVTEAPLPEGSHKFLIVSNRPYIADDPNGKVFPNEVSEGGKLTYLLAACDGEKWLINQVNDFMEGMRTIDDGRDILLYVHGHGKAFPAVLTRGHQLADKYGVSMILFDWASFNSNFNKSLSRVRKCGENYYKLLLHSLGNYFLTDLVVNENNQYIDGQIFDNIIMNSAAVQSKEHGALISQITMQENLYVILNKNDKVLKGANLITSWKMLGNVVTEPLATGATYIDFTAVAGTEHTYFAGYHPFEFEMPAFEQVFDTAFHGGRVDLSNPVLFSRKENLPIWEVIPPLF